MKELKDLRELLVTVSCTEDEREFLDYLLQIAYKMGRMDGVAEGIKVASYDPAVEIK